METFYFFLPGPGGTGSDLSPLKDLCFLLSCGQISVSDAAVAT